MENTFNQTSSIGAAWPPALATNERLRGFYTEGVITSQQEADSITEHVESAIDDMLCSDQTSRVSIRVVSEIGSLARLTFDRANIEAALPINNTDLVIAYIGANQDDRQMSTKRLTAHQALLHSLRLRNHVSHNTDLDIRIVDNQNTTHLVPAFTQLYRSFGYDRIETEQILGDSSNLIVYHQDGDVVASTAMAEKATIEISGLGKLSLVEITEASTHPAYRERGLYRAVSSYLIRHLMSLHRDGGINMDALYGESNLTMPGVVIAAHQNGRRFSYFDRDDLGSHNVSFGILPQNFAVADGSETRDYNDFAVSYVPLQTRRDQNAV